ncbi:LuxR C-terminal-related transcriptional regulator [Enterococcus sp. UD-01]|jgi:two-component system vancomycin resistance associated response regulator VraR|uniref:response regulator transcription factor n=1 Tax=Enterococcus sp. UD-01 TaxID=3373911 RepID=UPI00383732E0
MIKLVLIDDHALVLQGMQEKLSQSALIEVSGVFTSVEEFILYVTYQEYDVLIMDLMLHGNYGFDLVRKILNEIKPDSKIILISGFYDELLHKRALDLGVKAFLRKEASYEELIGAIVNVHQGNHIIPEFLIDTTSNQLLSEIELKVLKLIVDEYTNEKIAKELFISKRTVESHVSNICRKLNVNSRIGAVREAMRLNLNQ